MAQRAATSSSNSTAETSRPTLGGVLDVRASHAVAMDRRGAQGVTQLGLSTPSTSQHSHTLDASTPSQPVLRDTRFPRRAAGPPQVEKRKVVPASSALLGQVGARATASRAASSASMTASAAAAAAPAGSSLLRVPLAAAAAAAASAAAQVTPSTTGAAGVQSPVANLSASSGGAASVLSSAAAASAARRPTAVPGSPSLFQQFLQRNQLQRASPEAKQTDLTSCVSPIRPPITSAPVSESSPTPPQPQSPSLPPPTTSPPTQQGTTDDLTQGPPGNIESSGTANNIQTPVTHNMSGSPGHLLDSPQPSVPATPCNQSSKLPPTAPVSPHTPAPAETSIGTAAVSKPAAKEEFTESASTAVPSGASPPQLLDTASASIARQSDGDKHMSADSPLPGTLSSPLLPSHTCEATVNNAKPAPAQHPASQDVQASALTSNTPSPTALTPRPRIPQQRPPALITDTEADGPLVSSSNRKEAVPAAAAANLSPGSQPLPTPPSTMPLRRTMSRGRQAVDTHLPHTDTSAATHASAVPSASGAPAMAAAAAAPGPTPAAVGTASKGSIATAPVITAAAVAAAAAASQASFQANDALPNTIGGTPGAPSSMMPAPATAKLTAGSVNSSNSLRASPAMPYTPLATSSGGNLARALSRGASFGSRTGQLNPGSTTAANLTHRTTSLTSGLSSSVEASRMLSTLAAIAPLTTALDATGPLSRKASDAHDARSITHSALADAQVGAAIPPSVLPVTAMLGTQATAPAQESLPLPLFGHTSGHTTAAVVPAATAAAAATETSLGSRSMCTGSGSGSSRRPDSNSSSNSSSRAISWSSSISQASAPVSSSASNSSLQATRGLLLAGSSFSQRSSDSGLPPELSSDAPQLTTPVATATKAATGSLHARVQQPRVWTIPPVNRTQAVVRTNSLSISSSSGSQAASDVPLSQPGESDTSAAAVAVAVAAAAAAVLTTSVSSQVLQTHVYERASVPGCTTNVVSGPTLLSNTTRDLASRISFGGMRSGAPLVPAAVGQATPSLAWGRSNSQCSYLTTPREPSSQSSAVNTPTTTAAAGVSSSSPPAATSTPPTAAPAATPPALQASLRGRGSMLAMQGAGQVSLTWEPPPVPSAMTRQAAHLRNSGAARTLTTTSSPGSLVESITRLQLTAAVCPPALYRLSAPGPPGAAADEDRTVESRADLGRSREGSTTSSGGRGQEVVGLFASNSGSPLVPPVHPSIDSTCPVERLRSNHVIFANPLTNAGTGGQEPDDLQAGEHGRLVCMNSDNQAGRMAEPSESLQQQRRLPERQAFRMGLSPYHLQQQDPDPEVRRMAAALTVEAERREQLQYQIEILRQQHRQLELLQHITRHQQQLLLQRCGDAAAEPRGGRSRSNSSGRGGGSETSGSEDITGGNTSGGNSQDSRKARDHERVHERGRSRHTHQDRLQLESAGALRTQRLPSIHSNTTMLGAPSDTAAHGSCGDRGDAEEGRGRDSSCSSRGSSEGDGGNDSERAGLLDWRHDVEDRESEVEQSRGGARNGTSRVETPAYAASCGFRYIVNDDWGAALNGDADAEQGYLVEEDARGDLDAEEGDEDEEDEGAVSDEGDELVLSQMRGIAADLHAAASYAGEMHNLSSRGGRRGGSEEGSLHQRGANGAVSNNHFVTRVGGDWGGDGGGSGQRLRQRHQQQQQRHSDGVFSRVLWTRQRRISSSDDAHTPLHTIVIAPQRVIATRQGSSEEGETPGSGARRGREASESPDERQRFWQEETLRAEDSSSSCEGGMDPEEEAVGGGEESEDGLDEGDERFMYEAGRAMCNFNEGHRHRESVFAAEREAGDEAGEESDDEEEEEEEENFSSFLDRLRLSPGEAGNAARSIRPAAMISDHAIGSALSRGSSTTLLPPRSPSSMHTQLPFPALASSPGTTAAEYAALHHHHHSLEPPLHYHQHHSHAHARSSDDPSTSRRHTPSIRPHPPIARPTYRDTPQSSVSAEYAHERTEPQLSQQQLRQQQREQLREGLSGEMGPRPIDEDATALRMRLPLQEWMSQHAARLLLPYNMRDMADLLVQNAAPLTSGHAPSGGDAAVSSRSTSPQPYSVYNIAKHPGSRSALNPHLRARAMPTPLNVMGERKQPSPKVQSLMRDPSFLRNLIRELPGVDPTSSSVQHAVTTLKLNKPVDELQ